MDYSQYVQSKIKQTQPVPGKDMVPNNAGGFAFKLDKWDQLDRFLILGTEGGTYYVNEAKLTGDSFTSLESCMAEDCIRVIDRAVELSASGRAPKNDPALFVLAKACSDKRYMLTRQYALKKLPEVARIGTHLFHFVKYAKVFRGWGRAFRKGIANWYTEKSLVQLAFQTAKYKQRDGWSHRDLLRLSHPKSTDIHRNALFAKITHPKTVLETNKEAALEFYAAAEQTSTSTEVESAVELIRKYSIPRECVSTKLLNDRRVWDALLDNMPMTALLRNLGKLSSIGMTERHGADAKRIVQQLLNGEQIKRARVHPISILAALNVYQIGAGIAGKLTWAPNREIVEALNDAFYLSFDYVEPTNRRYLLGLDVSGSMYGNPVLGIAGMSAAMASAAMALVTLRTEPEAIIKGFTAGSSGNGWYNYNSDQGLEGFVDLNISKRMLLDQVIDVMRKQDMGRTDCALPMVWATKAKVPIDAFCVYTDNETYAGSIHPFQALQEYRQVMGIPAKLIVAGVSANDITIAEKEDPGMLDVVGFDSTAPQIISEFVKKNLDSSRQKYED